MTQKLAKNIHCVLLRNGIEIWLDVDRVESLKERMETSKHVELDGSIVSTTEIAGIFTPEHMQDYLHKKEGKWRCFVGNWHDRGQKCDCRRVIGYNKRSVDLGEGRIEVIDVPVYEGGKLDD